MDINPEAGKPSIIFTPIQQPDHSLWTNITPLPPIIPHLPGFKIDTEAGKIKIFSTPIHELNWRDLIHYKDNDKVNDDKIIKNSKKFGLDLNNPTERKILENLDASAEEFIVKHRQARIFREFPGEYLRMPIKEIIEAAKRRDNKNAITANKLIKDGRFSK